MPGVEIEILGEAIEQISREVLESMLANTSAIVDDEEAERIERTLQRIKAKQFITIPEFALLFNCSRGHVDKLLDQAQQPNYKYPVPYVDLNGLIQFDRLEVLECRDYESHLIERGERLVVRKNGIPSQSTNRKKLRLPKFQLYAPGAPCLDAIRSFGKEQRMSVRNVVRSRIERITGRLKMRSPTPKLVNLRRMKSESSSRTAQRG